jgi:hypothetical protein
LRGFFGRLGDEKAHAFFRAAGSKKFDGDGFFVSIQGCGEGEAATRGEPLGAPPLAVGAPPLDEGDRVASGVGVSAAVIEGEPVTLRVAFTLRAAKAEGGESVTLAEFCESIGLA